MNATDLDTLKNAIRDVQDFPKPGILFKDITPVLADPALFDLALRALMDSVKGRQVDKVVGIDARGFIFGAAIADRLKAGFIPMRKKGKLPYRSHEASYELEYGEATIQMHEDAFSPGENIFLVDDLLATGGTAAAALKLIDRLQGNLVSVAFLIELEFLQGRKRLDAKAPIHAILRY